MCCLEEVYRCYKCDVFSLHLDHLKFCVVCIYGRGYVRCSKCDVVSAHCGEVMTFSVVALGVSLVS